MKKMNGLVAVALAGLFSTGAQADFVTQWSYAVQSKWIAPTTFTAGNGTQIVSDKEISWGGDNNGGAAGVGDLIVNGGSRSGVLIENSPQAGTIDTNGSIMPTNTFSHINNPIDGSFATLRTATIETSLTLTPLSPAGAPLPTDTINFSINFSETDNDGSCVVGATSNCDDIFVVSFGALNNDFIYEGFKYFVSIVKTAGPLDPLSNSACAEAGAPNGCLGFLTREREKTSVDFGILITSSPLLVSEPGALALAGLGLLGLGMVRRRKSA